MKLSTLIRQGPVATATVATAASHTEANGGAVARIAAVAVAKPVCAICGTGGGNTMVVLIGKRRSEHRHLHPGCWAAWAARQAEAGAVAYGRWLEAAEAGEGAP